MNSWCLRTVFLGLALSMVSLGSSDSEAARLKLVVGGPEFRPFPVAVPKAEVSGGVASEGEKLAPRITKKLRDGAMLARSLELLPPGGYLRSANDTVTAPVYRNWLNIGASGLFRSTVEVREGQARLSLRFFDVVSQKELLAKSYSASLSDVEDRVLDFLDEVILLLTGEAGVFSSKIAYIKQTKAGKALYVSDINGSGERRLTDPSAVSVLPEWGPQGETLLFTSYLRSNPDLYSLDLKTKELKWLSNKRGLNMGAALSPDGTTIAFTLSVDGNTEIYTMDTKGGNLTRLTNSWGLDVSPSWSPDGKELTFVSSRSGNPHIYVMNADGTGTRRVSFRGNYNQEPDWSPRPGGKIAFCARDERLKYDIFLLDPATGDVERLTQDQGDNESPSFSPDGHHIVFTSTRKTGKKRLWIMDADGRNPRLISAGGGNYETPSWGPRLR